MIQALKKLDWILIGAILLLLAVGLLSIASISEARTGAFTILKKQIIFAAAGLILLLLFSFIDYRFLRNYSAIVLTIYIISIILLALLFVFGSQIRGATSWFRFGPPGGSFGFEPVEITKLILIALLSKYFSSRHFDFGLIRHIFISGFYVFIPTLLVLLQPDLGSAVLIIFIWVGIMLFSGIKAKHLLVLFLILSLIAAAGWFFLLKDYQQNRILTFLKPQRDPFGQGYYVIQ